ncbi:MAG TPA: argininosuccinate lyase [Anaerolineales bacterium]|nr:argininosuccinate lyase [Anaerolineales bacterium]
MKLWGGRFEGSIDPLAMQLNASLSVDKRLWDADIRGSVAWARALARAGVITAAEADELCAGLQLVWAEFNGGAFAFTPGDEDIHTAVERRLGEIVGAVGGKLHTGRSRNDQVATDFRLWLMEAIDTLLDRVGSLQIALIAKAEAELETILPGYTHTQRAQPILFSHWLLSHFWALQRDKERLIQTRARAGVMPLGSAALAGTGFAIDRQRLADSLGFDAVSLNSLDAVSDRDFAAEFLFDAAMIGSHLSRLADALILYSTAEFGFVEMADAYSTGSSIMPQKKNPDMLELARGKAGTLIGLLTGLLAVLKGLPSAYDKDLQEDKAPVFAAFDTLDVLLPVVAGTAATMTVNRERMRAAVDASLLATELADYLVRKGIPFRQAHAIVGQAVRKGIEKRVGIDQLSLDELREISPTFEADVRDAFDAERAVRARSVIGGTAPEAVRDQIAAARLAHGVAPHFKDDVRWGVHHIEQTTA